MFFNTPARLKFLKSDNTERRHIDMLVTRYAMAYPNVRFTLSQDERAVFQTTGSGSLFDVLIEALGLETARTLIEIPPRSGLPIQVYGYSSAPSLQRGGRNQITLFVNGRYIQDNALTHAISEAYHTLMPDDRFPVAVLLITLPPEDVDVNVHPTKAEVRFRAPDAVYGAVLSSVRRALIDYTQSAGSVPLVGGSGTETSDTSDVPADSDGPDSGSNEANTQANGQASAAFANRANRSPYSPTFDLHTADPGYRSQQMPSAPAYRSPGTLAPQPPTRSGAPTLPPLRVIGQIAAMYIAAEGPAGLYLIDQHAAHERVLYEQFMAQVAAGQPIAQRTLEATAVEVTAEAAALVQENAANLEALGLELEPFGERTFRVRAVPAILADSDPALAVKIILDDLANGDEPGESTAEARLILHVCKGAAVKAGQVLSYAEMQALIQQLSRCASPRSCPHGRPTLIHLSREQLAKEFGRT